MGGNPDLFLKCITAIAVGEEKRYKMATMRVVRHGEQKKTKVKPALNSYFPQVDLQLL